MNRFQLLEHTADMGIAAEGETLAELFVQAALGARQIITSCREIQPREALQVEVRGDDLEDLLVHWLAELLYLLESRRFLPASFAVEEMSEQYLLARVEGEAVDAGRHHLQREIKAVTYHQIFVQPFEGGWRAQVFVDL